MINDPIKGELSQAGKAAPTGELRDMLVTNRITPTKQLPPMRFLFKLNGIPCFPTCELVADTGRAKSGKTLFMSLIMACALNGKQLDLERTDDMPLRVLWFDTEQSEQSTQDILNSRILPMAGIRIELADDSECLFFDANDEPIDFDHHFFVLNVRGIGWEKRKNLLPMAITEFKPDLVILDGTKDLMLDINDATQATTTTEDLMLQAQLNKCCIVNVLHQNKSEADRNMRGSIGTELTNKAFEGYQCEYIEDSNIFKVQQSFSRKQRIKRKMYYQLNEEGLPTECNDYSEQPRDPNGRYASPKSASTVSMLPELKWETFNPNYYIKTGEGKYEWKLSQLFEDAFEGRASRPYNHVMGAALRLSHIVDKRLYYALYKEAQQLGYVKQTKHPETGETWVELIVNQIPF